MKNLFTLTAIAAVITLGACSGSKSNTAEGILDLSNTTPETLVNTLAEKMQSGDANAITMTVESIRSGLNTIYENGDIEKAFEFVGPIKVFVEENTEKLKELNVNMTALTDVLEVVKQCREQHILQRAEYIFKNLPDHKDIDDVDKTVFSSSFLDVLERASSLAEKLSEEGIIGMESVIYWYVSQDEYVDDGLQGISLQSDDDKTAVVKVIYKNCGVKNDHYMKLVYTDGKWYCDNWDSMKENLQEEMNACE